MSTEDSSSSSSINPATALRPFVINDSIKRVLMLLIDFDEEDESIIALALDTSIEDAVVMMLLFVESSALQFI